MVVSMFTRSAAVVGAAGTFFVLSAIGCSSSSTTIETTHDGGSSTSNDASKNDATSDGGSKHDGSTQIPDAAGSSDASDAAVVVPDGSSSGTPTLTALSVTPVSVSDGSASVALVPPFSPTTYDYYVRCSAGSNALRVAMTASTGATSSLTQPSATGSAAMQSLAVTVAENQAIVAVATEGTAKTEYWVRCLPHDFPKLSMVTHPDAGTPPAGYYLLGNLMANASAGYAMVMNGDGVPVWYYAMGAGLGVVDVDDGVSGALTFAPYSATKVEEFSVHQLSPVSTTTITPTGFATDNHELRVLANGNYLMLSYPLKSGVDLTGISIASTVDGGVPLTPGPNSTIQDCAVIEVTASGSVVSTWLASDHFDPAKDSTLPLTGFGAGATAMDGGTVYDVFHCNSIDVDPANGNLLVSAREMDSVFYVDRPSGKVLWKMGGATASLDNATYVSVADPFFRQHDARFQPGWSPSCNGGTGEISLFDDETQKPGPARSVVYTVVVGGADGGGATSCDGGAAIDGGAAGQATLAWQYKGKASAAATGSFRITGDGSRVIGWGFGGTPDLAFTEVDVNGNDLLDFNFPDGNSTYRAIKVPLTAFDLGVLRSTAGGQ